MNIAGKDSRQTGMPTRSSEDDLVALVPARSRRRDFGVGLFVIVGLLAALIALFVLTDAATFRGRYIVTTHVQDAGGIRRGDPVQMRGVNIGRVQRFDITPRGVAIRMELDRDYPVPRDSRVELRSSGLLGGMIADVVPGRSQEDAEDGDVLAGGTAPGAFAAAASVGSRADTVLTQVQTLLSDQTVGALGQGALELRTLLHELAIVIGEQRRELNLLTSSLNRSAVGLERVTTAPELGSIATRTDSMMLRLDQTSVALQRVSGSLDSVLGRMERGEGTLGRLTRDESLYENLNAAAVNINRLVADIRANPNRYFNVRVF